MGFSKLSSLLGDKSPNGVDDQPRLPKGDPHGGRWTRMDVFAGENEEDDTDSDGPLYVGEPIRLAQAGAASDVNRPVPGLTVLNSVLLDGVTHAYRRLQMQAKEGQLPVFEFKPREYSKEEGKEIDLAGVRTLEREEAEQKCPRNGDIQTLTDRSAKDVRAWLQGQGVSPQKFGTVVHSTLERRITGDLEREFAQNMKERIDHPGPTDAELARGLSAEISYKDGDIVGRGTPGSVRLDVSYSPEHAPKRMCVGDIKTGARGLDARRAAELAMKAAIKNPKVDEFLVFEFRPSQ